MESEVQEKLHMAFDHWRQMGEPRFTLRSIWAVLCVSLVVLQSSQDTEAFHFSYQESFTPQESLHLHRRQLLGAEEGAVLWVEVLMCFRVQAW